MHQSAPGGTLPHAKPFGLRADAPFREPRPQAQLARVGGMPLRPSGPSFTPSVW